MSLIRPQGGNRRFKKTSDRKLSMRKNAIKNIPSEETDLADLEKYFKLDGETPIYLMFDPDREFDLYADTKPFTLAQAKKVHGEGFEEEE